MCARLTKSKSKIKVKALILLSGGLDSTLAAHLIRQQAVELVGLNFTSPFCLCKRGEGCSSHGVGTVAAQLGIKLETIDKTKEMLECVKRPKYGYGSNMNPCIDCRVIMLKKAKEHMQKCGASFVITGEVLGQRPMSQRRQIFGLIEKASGLEGLILRPLCAKSLPQTLPEEKGWVDRGSLLSIVGRSRKEQMRLALHFGVNDYPCPAGGCLLTDPNFAKRIRDLLRYNPQFSLNDVLLLKLGRHLRISDECKLIVGRNEKENSSLLNLALNTDLIFLPPEEIAGPTALGRGKFREQDRSLASSIVSRYCDRVIDIKAKITIEERNAKKLRYWESMPISDTEIGVLRI